MKKKLAIINTHPIQYYAPIFKLLTERNKIEVKVFYTWPQAVESFVDTGFGKEIKWDIPLLEGYSFELVPNTSKNPTSKKYSGIENPDLIKWVEVYQPQAILVFGWNFKSHLSLLRHFKGKIPVLFRGDSHLMNEKNGIQKLFRRIGLQWVYGHIDKAFYVGSNNKEYYLKHGVKKQNLISAPHAIENERFSSDSNVSVEFLINVKQQFGINGSDKVFLFCGKFEVVKNISLLISAFDLTFGACPKVHLVVVGNGPLEKELKEQAFGFKNVHFLPFQNQRLMSTIYRLGDVFVLPSKSETWGLAVNEAMACGKAVLVSDKVGCAIDLVHPGQNGYIFRNNDMEDLKEKLSLLADSDVKEMGKKSQEIIRQFSFENICTALEKELSKIE